jgi:hypothetical protein
MTSVVDVTDASKMPKGIEGCARARRSKSEGRLFVVVEDGIYACGCTVVCGGVVPEGQWRLRAESGLVIVLV